MSTYDQWCNTVQRLCPLVCQGRDGSDGSSHGCGLLENGCWSHLQWMAAGCRPGALLERRIGKDDIPLSRHKVMTQEYLWQDILQVVILYFYFYRPCVLNKAFSCNNCSIIHFHHTSTSFLVQFTTPNFCTTNALVTVAPW